MSHDHDHKLPIPDHYEGDFDFTNGKFAMWLFLVSDAMAFIGFLGAYMVLRMGTVITNDPNAIAWRPDWSPPLDLILTGLNTFVLIISSVTMVKALAAFQEGKQALGKTFLLATIAGGSFFVGFQVWEWNHLIH
ncbi:MAG TPA: cytochrome c oxidase subunit 3, partial [Planctomycetota bacterium]|nr:cytochrome c oxidase subunit 3 [Planctomycetota bacterium]